MRLWTILLMLAAAALLVWAYPDKSIEEEAMSYCKNVHARKWPDFDNIYRQQCHNDGTVNWEYVYGR